jgi:hypothetical protein
VSDRSKKRCGLQMNLAPHPFNVHFFFSSSVCFPVERVKFEDRACCEIGSNVPSKKCPNKTGIIVGSTIASLFVICCCGWVFYKKCYKREVRTTNTPKKATLVSATLPDDSVLASSHVIPGVQELSSSEELSSFLSTNAFSLVCFSA